MERQIILAGYIICVTAWPRMIYWKSKCCRLYHVEYIWTFVKKSLSDAFDEYKLRTTV